MCLCHRDCSVHFALCFSETVCASNHYNGVVPDIQFPQMAMALGLIGLFLLALTSALHDQADGHAC